MHYCYKNLQIDKHTANVGLNGNPNSRSPPLRIIYLATSLRPINWI